MNTSITRWFGGVLLFGTLALVGCGGPEYDNTEITFVTKTALGGDLTNQRLDLPEGLFITAHIVAWNDKKDPMALEIRPKDSSIVEVVASVNNHGFVFKGQKAGQTEVQFFADGSLVTTIQATVTPQPDSPQ